MNYCSIAKNDRHNKCVNSENKAGSRVLLAQHPRPSLISGYDSRYALKKDKMNTKGKIVIKVCESDNCE